MALVDLIDESKKLSWIFNVNQKGAGPQLVTICLPLGRFACTKGISEFLKIFSVRIYPISEIPGNYFPEIQELHISDVSIYIVYLSIF